MNNTFESHGSYICHYGRKGMKWGQHIFGEDPTETINLSAMEVQIGGEDTEKRKFFDRPIPPLDEEKVNQIAYPHSPDDDERNVNKRFDRYDEYTSRNCQDCTVAYEMRRRGYDVKAVLNPIGQTANDMKKWYRGYSEKNFDKQDIPDTGRAMYTKLMEEPIGSRGNISLHGKMSGHSVIYEIEKNDVCIRDTQSNSKYRGIRAMDYLGLWDMDGSRFGRTDNLEINWDNINRAVMRYDEEDPKHK